MSRAEDYLSLCEELEGTNDIALQMFLNHLRSTISSVETIHTQVRDVISKTPSSPRIWMTDVEKRIKDVWNNMLWSFSKNVVIHGHQVGINLKDIGGK